MNYACLNLGILLPFSFTRYYAPSEDSLFPSCA